MARTISAVPTPRTRKIAAAMIRDAEQVTGFDAALAHAKALEADQLLALIGVLLTATKQHKKVGRPARPLRFTEEQRREGNRRYKAGDRTPEVMAKWREYQRVARARHTARRRVTL